ncbi:hypothetical protein Dimus_020783 [Dionaea muscipula]
MGGKNDSSQPADSSSSGDGSGHDGQGVRRVAYSVARHLDLQQLIESDEDSLEDERGVFSDLDREDI